METPDKKAEEIVKKLKAQHPDLNEEDFLPHAISDNAAAPDKAKGDPTEEKSPKNGPQGFFSLLF